jgi:hypothetical protein
MTRHSYWFRVALVFVVVFGAGSLFDLRSQPPASKVADNAIPTPESILGFKPGADRTIADWGQITGYFSRLDQASDRITLRTIGQSTQGRPLVVAFISAPENLQKLGDYAAIQQKLADPRTITEVAERDRLLNTGKVVIAVSCSIHSTEIVASQMSMRLAYELATAQDEATLTILRNTIVLLIPSPNPDGIDIVANWYRKTLNTPYEGTNPPELYHQYAGHDDNRDWFMLNLPETRAITRLFWKEWFPEIVYDLHQMDQVGPRMFVPPFYSPANPGIAPVLLREAGAIGYRMAADLQAEHFPGIVTDAIFDAWWHGGFRTAPYYHNSIGLLSEAASAKLMTPIRKTEEDLAKAKPDRGLPSLVQPGVSFPDPWRGGIWGPHEIMEMELTAVRSVLTTAAQNRVRYLRNFYDLGRTNATPVSYRSDPYAYFIPPVQGNDEQVARMLEILIEQGIEVLRLNRELHIYAVGSRVGFDAPAGGYLILLAQPQRANVRALFERQVYPAAPGATSELDHPYDVAGWTLPMMMGVEYSIAAELAETLPQIQQHTSLVRNAAEIRKDLSIAPQTGERSPIPNPVKPGVRVGVYRGSLPSSDEGWTRFVLDTYNVPYRSINDAAMRAGKLGEQFDVIVLPSQSEKQIVEGLAAGTYPDENTGGITEAGVESLRAFVDDGGTLICFDDSTQFAINRLQLPVKNVLADLKMADFFCPGSILRINVDTQHPIGRLLRPETDVYFVDGAAFDRLDEKRVTVIARYATEQALRSGWLRGEKYLAGKIALAEVTQGRGRVILFGFRPQHRGQTWGTFPFIFNAINRGR